MSLEEWIIFTGFWALFVTMPGPNAVNCIAVASEFGFRKSLVCVAAILSQATLFGAHYSWTLIHISKYSRNTYDFENYWHYFSYLHWV